MLDALYQLVNVSCLAVGLCGAIVHVCFTEEKVSARDALKYLIGGMLAANFIAPQMLKMLFMFPLDFIAFGVGMTGKHLCLGIEIGFSKIKLLGKTKNE